MSLTFGSGPFGIRPAGAFNVKMPREGLLYVEQSQRWVRGEFAGETIVDSRRPQLVHESAQLPRYYFPRQDVRTELLEPGSGPLEDPIRGTAQRWTLRVENEVREDAAISHADPPHGAQALAGLLSFSWPALDRWFEEGQELGGIHPRDPYHRLDPLPTTRRVRVELDGQVIAESRNAIALFETALPARWYVPFENVRMELLSPIDLTSKCAYKGTANYWSLQLGDRHENALAWSYEQPRHEAAAVAGKVAFFNERVDLFLDGELQERPRTRWNDDEWTRVRR